MIVICLKEEEEKKNRFHHDDCFITHLHRDEDLLIWEIRWPWCFWELRWLTYFSYHVLSFFLYNNSSNNNNNINNDNSFVWKEKMKEQTKMSRNVLNGWSLINCYGDGTPNGRWTCICEDFCIASPYLIMIDG